MTCVKRLCGTGQPAAPGPGVILSRGEQGRKHTLPFVSPDIDRWVTGSSLLPGHHKMKAIGGWGLREGVSNQMTSHMTMFWRDNTSKQGGIVLLVVFDTKVVGWHPKTTIISVM